MDYADIIKNKKSRPHIRFWGCITHRHLLFLLVVVGFVIRIIYAKADPFLHDWDERFHALVARNMMDTPLTPMLKTTTLLSYDDLNAWCCNHIWLHKQPLFLWQMALSMKIFGVSELSMRLPSVIMGTLMIMLLYRITFLWTNNKNTALIAATLICFSKFNLDLIGGMKGMEHNDLAFGFYTLASFWAFCEYLKSKKWSWVLAIGLLAGCAILNKWLTGLAVFLAWGIHLLGELKQKNGKELVRFLVALLFCCLVFIPWQVYIFHAFPEQARYESALNLKHVFEVVENHDGSVWFYLEKFPEYFGSFLWLGVFAGLILAFFTKSIHKKMLFPFTIVLLFIFCFFSFIVKTKVHTYFFVLIPLGMIFIAISLNALYSRINKKALLFFLIVLAGYFSLNPKEINAYFSAGNNDRNRKIHNTNLYKNKNLLPDGVKVVMGLNSLEDVEFMFYNKDIAANHWYINKEDLDRLAKARIPVAVFKNRGSYTMPEYVTHYPYLFIINEELK